MIRFSAALVVVAVGILVAGGVTSKLLLVYIAVALSAVALVFLLIGAFLDRDELRAGVGETRAGPDQRAAERSAPDQARADEADVVAAADRPTADRPTEGWSAEDRSAEDRSAEDRSAEDTVAAGDRDDAGDSDDAADAGSAGSSSSGDSSGAGRSLDRERSERLAYRDELVYRESNGFQSPEWPGRPGRYLGPQTGAPPEPVPIRPDPSRTRPEGLPAPGNTPAEARADLTVELPPLAPGQPGLSEQPTALEPPEPSQTAEPRPPQPTEPATERARESGPTPEAGPSHHPAPSAEAEPPATQGNGGLPDHHEVTVVPGVPRYHKSECILIRFMGDGDLQKMTVAAARDGGCTPCRACQPDGAEAD